MGSSSWKISRVFLMYINRDETDDFLLLGIVCRMFLEMGGADVFWWMCSVLFGTFERIRVLFVKGFIGSIMSQQKKSLNISYRQMRLLYV